MENGSWSIITHYYHLFKILSMWNAEYLDNPEIVEFLNFCGEDATNSKYLKV